MNNFQEFFTTLSTLKIIPVIKIDSVDQALPLAEALQAGELPGAEITFRTEAAAGAIKAIRSAFPTMITGAGTVINLEQAQRAIDAGAQFFVSPGYDPELVDFAQSNTIPILPGINNPTGIQQALKQGLDVVKFFPAEASGGVAMIDALSAPFPQVRFMPTGGIGVKNLSDYLNRKAVLAVGGSWMVPGTLIAEGKWKEIEALTRDAVLLAGQLRT
jgi:2-dehydro-3-deoxyphosphogluconate aldolase/(4S)-4-hydroxy-2-oxoglutarate aldolase